MNKKLVALAVGAIAAGAAGVASAQNANVTLYGSVRLAVESAKVSGGKRITSVRNVSSRFGLRGTESLGGGLNAIFQLEAGIAPDVGTGEVFSREGWVGLNGGFGTFKLGYGLTPYDSVVGMQHQQGANGWENVNAGVSGGAGFMGSNMFARLTNAAASNTSAFDARYGNSVRYETPNFGGFKLATQYALIGEGGSGSPTGWDTALTYANGPISAGLAYSRHDNFVGIGATGTSLAGETGFGTNDQQALRVGLKYNAGFATFDAAYEIAEYKSSIAKLKYNYWGVGAVVPVGSFTVGAQYGQRDKGLAAGSFGTQRLDGSWDHSAWGDGGGKHWSVKADYSLSKRTLVRANYTQMKNETGTKLDAFSVGLWHHF